jgi:Uma2 family endonuclease
MATIIKPTSRLRPWRLSVDKYLKMIEAGIITEEDRVFLWEGWLLEKMTKGRPHTLVTMRICDALRRVLTPGCGYYVEQEQPVALVRRRDTMPEPDLMVVRGRPDDYPGTPTARDVPLIVEVADSTLPFDMGKKMRRYAAESIASYWVASVSDRWIVAFDGPIGRGRPTRYASSVTYRAGGRVPVMIDGVAIGHVAVDEIFLPGDAWP